ncbi:transcription factor HES-3 [Cricetulus griseus]|uniref:Transcription factor HES-3 n=2 Tax=Cricetulus griseus TaxID=10029 RepID=G3IJV5_CRIGR|nr:transcription factor HES-3 [Cricetulus griseus]XP_027254176.1 transcription factor HES-3 [Cricetulus griseus]EGW10850.1 Transcription factor HES-3 [Cricetulus griseus]
MGTEPTSRGSPSGSASSFRKISKPLMEKKRRARINMSLEQLKSLLERHYSHQIRKRKLEKADILELSVKYMKSLQSSSQGLWPVPSGVDYPSGFQGCLPGVSQRLRRGGASSGLRCPLVLERRAGSTTDSASSQALSVLSPCLPAVWAPPSAAGSSQAPLSSLPLPRGLPESSTGAPAPQPAPNCQTEESARPGLGLWRPW